MIYDDNDSIYMDDEAAGGCYLHVRRDSAGVIPPLWVVECTYWTMKLTDSSPCLSSP